MIEPAKKPIQQTVILCLLVLLFTFPKHGGFMLGFVLLLLTPSLLKSLYFIFIKKKERKQRSIQTALWAITCSITTIHHIYLHKSAQTFASKVSDSVVAYYQKHGIYPESYKVLGFSKESMREFKLFYSYKDNKPFLFYSATWIVYDAYIYDFAQNKWRYQSS